MIQISRKWDEFLFFFLERHKFDLFSNEFQIYFIELKTANSVLSMPSGLGNFLQTYNRPLRPVLHECFIRINFLLYLSTFLFCRSFSLFVFDIIEHGSSIF